MKKRILSMLVLLAAVVTGAVAQTTYKVSVKEGTEDATSWTITPTEATTTGVAAGTEVKATYNGTKHVKSVKAKKAAVADPLAVPLTMEAITAGTIKVNNPQSGMQYTLNGGTKTAVSGTINVTTGDKVAFYGNGTSINNYDGTTIAGGTAQVKVYGNIMSLIDETGYATLTTLPNQDFVFFGLFANNANLTDASGLLLPATTAVVGCYNSMFNGCTSLTAAPALPATTLANACYIRMFYGCTSLTTAPELPATTLVEYCYSDMFSSCTNLSSVTCLATDISASSCTDNWLDGVAATGTFTKAASMSSWTTGASGIPSGWTVNEQ